MLDGIQAYKERQKTKSTSFLTDKTISERKCFKNSFCRKSLVCRSLKRKAGLLAFKPTLNEQPNSEEEKCLKKINLQTKNGLRVSEGDAGEKLVCWPSS